MISLYYVIMMSYIVTIKISGFYKTSPIKNKKENGVSELKKGKRFKEIEY